MKKNFLRRVRNSLAASLILGTLNFMPACHAEIQTYIGVGEHIMTDKDTYENARQGAKMQALRAAQEQAGVAISSRSIVQDFKMVKDEITAFTSGILQLKNEKFEPVILNDTNGYIKLVATVEVSIDIDDLNEKLMLWLSRNDSDRSDDIAKDQEKQKIIDSQAQRIAQLEQLIASNTPQDTEKVNREIASLDKDAKYVQKLEEGDALYAQKNTPTR